MNLLDNINVLNTQKFKWGEISWLHEPVGSSYRRLSMAQVKVYPGCHQEKHRHSAEEQLFYFVQGNGKFIVDGKEENVHKSMAVYIEPYSEHEIINCGYDELIFIVVYVPIKLMELEKTYTVSVYENIQDVIPLDVLDNIQKQLSELLKVPIHIYDRNHRILSSGYEENDFCKACSSVQQCNKRKDGNGSRNQLDDTMYKCDYNLIELEIPITLNDNTFGYIKSSCFTFNNSERIDEKIDEIGIKSGIERSRIWNAYKAIPNIIKSRIYVIGEHLSIASQFIQIMLQRSILEHELVTKDNEILINAKEKILLKDALKKISGKIFTDKIFTASLGKAKEIVYPYELELTLENAIKELDASKINESILGYRNIYVDSEEIVQEMIVVLSRTALRKLENVEIVSQMRKKYDKYLRDIKKEDPWEILKGFCMDCIQEYEKVIQNNGRELIDNINIYIKSHYREDLNLNLIADLFFISPNYLSSLFNEKNKISFSDYIQNLRIEEAKEYLKTTNMKVYDIGKRVGYKNNSYFINIFKKSVGMTPSEFRKS